jgi:hypothetical protein
VRAAVGLGKPGVELLLEVELVRERAAGLEVSLRVALQPLDGPFGLRVARFAEPPADPKLAAESGERLGRAALAAVDPRLSDLLCVRPGWVDGC